MPIYRAKVPGLKPLLLYADSAAKAKDQLVELEAMSAADMAAALAGGLTIWKPGEPVDCDLENIDPEALKEFMAEQPEAEAQANGDDQTEQLSDEDVAAAEAGPHPARKRGSPKVDAE